MEGQKYVHAIAKNLLNISLILITALAGCSKSDIQRIGSLEVSELEPVVDASGGAFTLDIQSNSSWKLGKIESDWLTPEQTQGEGNSALTFTLSENTTVDSRTAEFFIVAEGGRSYEKIQLTQLSADPFVTLEQDALDVVSRPRSHMLELSTNVPESAIRIEVLYEKEEDAAWVVGALVQGDSLRFQTTINTLNEKRIAHIILSYGDEQDEESNAWDKITITQMDASNDLPPEDKPFDYVKAFPAGDIEENIAIRGNIVSTGSSDNFRANTYIIQDAGGNAIAFEPVESLDLAQYDQIQLLLDGARVESFRDAGMDYKRITGITAANVLEKAADPGFTPPSVSIDQLSEQHLLSLVTLKEVEFAIPYGAYSNFHEYYPQQTYAEYATRHYPVPLHDKQGNSLYLVTNRDVSYRRSAVPEGSGSITGLVVKIMDSAYGDLGAFSIRQLKESDVDISASKTDRFSKVLVEWEQQWSSGDFTNGTQHLPPTIGPSSAILNKDESDGFYYNTKAGGIYLIDKYRGNQPGSGTAVSKSTFNVNSWGTGRYWLLDKVSTLGIHTALYLQIEGNSSGNWGPRDFAVEYALDGETWTRVDTYELTGQIAPGKSEFVIASGKMFTFKLPDALLNQENIMIRLLNVSATSVDGNQTTATATSRLSHFSITYRK